MSFFFRKALICNHEGFQQSFAAAINFSNATKLVFQLSTGCLFLDEYSQFFYILPKIPPYNGQFVTIFEKDYNFSA